MFTATMPFYRFHVDVNVPPLIVAERIKAVVGKGSFLEFTSWWSPDPGGRPFKGTVSDDSFRVRRYISYRNSFLPLIWGRLRPTPTGTRVNVTMFLHPAVAVFMGFWIGATGLGAVGKPSFPVVWAFFVIGILMTIGGFFPEAIKARRLISKVVQNTAITPVQQ